MLKRKRFSSSKLIFFVVSILVLFGGCGNVVIYQPDGSITNLKNERVRISKKVQKIAIDKKLIEILEDYERDRDIEPKIDKLNTEIVYNSSFYYINDQDILYKNSDGYSILCLVIMSRKSALFDFLINNVDDKKKLLNYESLNGCTPLKLVIVENDPVYFKKLVNNEAISISEKYIGYALKNGRYDMAYELLKKVNNDNIPLEKFVHYASRNKNFSKKYYKIFFENQLLPFIHNEKELTKIINDISQKIGLNKSGVFELYSIAFNKTGILPKNEYALKILLTHDPEFKKSYHNIHNLIGYMKKIPRSSPKYWIAYERYVELKISSLNKVSDLEKFMKKCKTQHCKDTCKKKIKKVKIANVMKELKRKFFYYDLDYLVWDGLFDDHGWPSGKGKFVAEKIIGGSFLSNYLAKIEIYVTFKNHKIDSSAPNYVSSRIFKRGLIFTTPVSKTYTRRFYNISSMNDAIMKTVNMGIRKFKVSMKRNMPSCKELFKKCIKSCEHKSTKGFFNDKSSCQTYCYMAKDSCKEKRYKSARRNYCMAICLGAEKYNGGLFGSSDYDMCVNNCMR